jgi:uncharacterized protein YjbI with pentapeptide repeats
MPEWAIAARSRPALIAARTLAAILGLAAVAAYVLALWKVPDWMHLTKPQNRHNARLLVISVGGALVVLTGLLYTARNYRLSRRGQVTDRFTIALERLGSTELYVRIGGVHALVHVMRDSPYHHDDVIEVLTQFIRGRVPLARPSGRQDQFDRKAWMHPVTGSVPDPLPAEPTPDVQAALTALAHRPLRPERRDIDLHDLHLTRANLSGANLTGAFLDSANLTRAFLGDANLTLAFLDSANLTRAHLTRANLTGAGLRGADLTCALLLGANLTGALLYGANLTGADLRGANLTCAFLDGANLTGARLDVADLTRASLDVADLTGAFLRDADLTRAFLLGANLTGARLDGANLTGARLGAHPPNEVVPPGWIVTNPETGELTRRPAGSASSLGMVPPSS